MEYATTAANIEAHCRLMREHAAKRSMRRALWKGLELADDPTASAAGLRASIQTGLDAVPIEHAGNRFGDAAIRAQDLMAETIDPPRSLLGDRVLTAGGLAILYGKPGLGKSWLAMALARALVRGEPWLGVPTATGGCRVGLVQLELHDHAMQGRLCTLGIGRHERDGGLLLVCRPRLRGVVDLFRQPDDVAALRAWIKAERLDVVVIDALSRAHTASENKAEELGQVLAVFDALRHETGCAIVLVHHEPKEREGRDSENDLDALRGSSRLQSDPTLLVRVRRSRGHHSLRFVKVSEGPAPSEVYFALDDDGTPQVIPSPEAIQNTNRQRVLDAVQRAEGSVSRADVQEVTKLSKSTVADHLRALAGDGRINVAGEGRDTRYATVNVRPTEASDNGASDGVSPSPHNGLEDSGAEPSAYDREPAVRPSEPTALKGGSVGRTLEHGGPPDGGGACTPVVTQRRASNLQASATPKAHGGAA